VSDQPLRERLLIAIDGKGAFRRFKDVLLAFPAERERWFAYRSSCCTSTSRRGWTTCASRWRTSRRGVTSRSRPSRPRSARRPSGEAPGEILRRQARDLLDEIPAAELPPALAFLEFLRDRGPSSLLGAAAPPASRARARRRRR
jgi:hypothetical protein